MRTWRTVLLGTASLLAGCAGGAMGADGSDLCDSESQGLTLEPQVIDRGADVQLRVAWVTRGPVYPPATATLTAGVDAEGEPGAVLVEIDVPLSENADDYPDMLYEGLLANPFGAGTPAGGGSALAVSGTSGDCLAPVTATTPFELR